MVTEDFLLFTQDQRQEFQVSWRKVTMCTDLLDKVFSFLDPASVKNVRLVCRLVLSSSNKCYRIVIKDLEMFCREEEVLELARPAQDGRGELQGGDGQPAVGVHT